MEIRIELFGEVGASKPKRTGTLILTKVTQSVRSDLVLLRVVNKGETHLEPTTIGRCLPYQLHDALKGLGLVS